jgi:hypothetical protein
MNIDAPLAQVEKLLTEMELLTTMWGRHFDWRRLKAWGLWEVEVEVNMLAVDVRAQVMFRLVVVTVG